MTLMKRAAALYVSVPARKRWAALGCLALVILLF